jgi:hypothetical protein
VQAKLTCVGDRTALVPARADEENGAHRLDPDGEEEAHAVPAVDLAAVRSAEA